MANKRIIDLTDVQNIAEDDYVILDSNTNGTRKILASNIGGSSGGVNYSTTEQDTGLKWIDGKPIYCKTITDISNNSNYSLASLNIDKLIKYEGNWLDIISSTPYVRGLDSYDNEWGWSNIMWNADNHTLRLSMRASGNYGGSIITIYYTKTTDTV